MNQVHTFHDELFPRSNQYHPDWIRASVGGGAHSLWLTEWLASGINFSPGMNVLDLGCGLATSSIFLSHEFKVRVWATDLWYDVSGNFKRIQHAGLEHSVFPIHADARSLPFASEFFDAIVSIDSFPYYGTDDHYLNYLARFVKPGGVIAIAGAAMIQEIEGELPPHLQAWWSSEPGMWCLHSAAWWQRHWQRTGIVDIELADSMPDGWRRWLKWHHAIAPDNRVEIEAIEQDRGVHLGYGRVISRRRLAARLEEPIVSVPTQFIPQPLLRHAD